MVQLYQRLVWTFRAEVYELRAQALRVALARAEQGDEPQQLHRPDGRQLRRARDARRHGAAARRRRRRPTSIVPDPDYVLTLDADSVLLPEYCLRLVHLMEQPENERVAVAQTPYSAFPGAADPDRADRRRDDRHPAHRPPGHDALRRDVLGRRQRRPAQARARRDRARPSTSAATRSGATSRTAPSSRTPSRASTSALKGWTLYNYPERLSYSATPPDFGSLCIQRQRWANGGLLILAKFRRYVVERRRSAAERRAAASCSCALNYLASIVWASVGLMVLLVLSVQRRAAEPDRARDRAARTSWRWRAT